MPCLAVRSRFWGCRLGATAIEYAMIAGLVAILLVPGLMWLRDWQQGISEKLNEAVGGGHAVVAERDDRAPVYPPREDRAPSIAPWDRPKP